MRTHTCTHTQSLSLMDDSSVLPILTLQVNAQQMLGCDLLSLDMSWGVNTFPAH